jgi:hypothetical protein
MTMLNRSAPDAPPNVALTDIEIGLLDHLVKDKRRFPPLRLHRALDLVRDVDRSALCGKRRNGPRYGEVPLEGRS